MAIYPGATWKPVNNHGGPMSAHLGLVLHVQEGNGGLQGWFNNPAAGASSTWWAGKAGGCEQYVDSNLQAWAQSAGNATYNSVETEGYVAEALTGAQIDVVGGIYAWGHQTYGWPFVLAEAPGQPGLGWHGMGGQAWGGHTGCPGDIRKSQRTAILQAAQGGQPVPPIPPPEPEPDKELEIMPTTVQWNNQTHVFNVDVKSGRLVHWWNDPARPGWPSETLGPADALVGTPTVDTGLRPDQLHVFCTREQGGVLHLWTDLHHPGWPSETLAP